jgi:phospholipase/carboxylesterase
LSSDETETVSISGYLTICWRRQASFQPVIFLHGSSSDETSLTGLAGQIAPAHPCYFPRGQEKDDGAFTFFRRRADRSVDTSNLASRSQELASLLMSIAERHETAPLLIGYSSGAVTAAALLVDHPHLVAGAVLLRPEPPYGTRAVEPLGRRPVLLIAGKQDPRRQPSDATNLAELMKSADAEVELHALPYGHAVEAHDIELTRAWLARRG